MKKYILIRLFILISLVSFSQEIIVNNKDYNLRDSLNVDYIDVKYRKVVFIANDQVFNSYITIDTFGVFNIYTSKKELDNHIKLVERGYFTSFNHEFNVTRKYKKCFKFIDAKDTIYSYRNEDVEYYEAGKLRTDNLGIPILEYDIEHSYILQKTKQNISSPYIYCLINEGTYRADILPVLNYIRRGVLLKLDATQDTTYNFFKYEAKSISYDGMQLTAKDSAIIPLKQLKKKKWIYNDIGEFLLIKSNSEVYSINYELTYVLMINGERYVVSGDNLYNYNRERKFKRWERLVENISYKLKTQQEKIFN